MDSKISLYGLVGEEKALDELLYMDGGEITPEYEELESNVKAMIVSKVDACCAYMNREHDLIKIARERIAELQSFIKVRENKVARFEQYIKDCVSQTDEKKLSGVLHEFKLRKPSKVLVIDNEDALPPCYVSSEVITTIKIDKAAIKKDIKEGKDIEGARLEDGKVGLILGLKKGK